MEEETNVTTSEQAPQEVTKAKRPTFLTVLCILSYIGVGLAVITSLVALTAGKAGSMFMNAAKDMEGMEAPGMETASKGLQYASSVSAISLISALVVLVGVIMMWKLKKTGYYIYIVGEIAPVIASFLLIGMSGFFGGFMAMIGLIFPVLFIILYGLNVKHMA